MGVVSSFLDDGVISPIGVIFRDVYCFPNKMIGGEEFFPLFFKFFWKIAFLFGDFVR